MFGAPKIAKSQRPDKSFYTLYNPHTISYSDIRWTSSSYKILSIDPGVKNLAIAVETRPYPSGKITLEWFSRYTLSPLISLDENGFEIVTYKEINMLFDEHIDLLLSVNIIVIERQLPFNYKTIRISQHIISYLMLKLANIPSLPVIFEVDPKMKTKLLGYIGDGTKRSIKEWAVEKAISLLKIRDDEVSIKSILTERNHRGVKKADDLADTLCMIEAICVLNKLPLSL